MIPLEESLAQTWQPGDWVWSVEHGKACRLVEIESLWGERVCRAWFPDEDLVVRVHGDQLEPVGAPCARLGPSHIDYITAAARVADALTQDVLLAPIESSIITLPHQILVLSRAMSDSRVRYLLADEVGLGKTIEAGLILRELKLRGLVKRTLVVTPKSLLTQWVAEMKTRFGEEFRLLIPSDFEAYRRLVHEENLWRAYDQVVCSMDSVKPIDERRGRSPEQVAQHNRERFEDLIAAGWDLVIVDEAHRLGGSTEQIARYKLGRTLADVAPYVLLLSATPHQGKTDAFHRLISLLDEEAFPDPASVSRERVEPYVIRTEKRRAIDAEGKPLFKPRHTRLVPVSWEERHRDQRTLYSAVTEYVRKGYNQAIKEKKHYIGFLMLLMQRLVTSSTRAIRTTLERRLEVLQAPEHQLTLFPELLEDEWDDLNGQEQVESVLKMRMKALKSEQSEVEFLLEAARSTEGAATDAKAEALLDWIYRLQQEEGDPDLKFLIFTEFIPTQEMLRDFLTDRGFTVVCLNGSMSIEERNAVQEAFANDARMMISTDAGGEGLNLQFCHVAINYDIPWNPMRLEQRIGRVDRIGQARTVRALNFVLQDTVEFRVREVLEQKLAIILEEFGVDKTGDVLDSAQAERMFDELYAELILHPETIEASVQKVLSEVEEAAESAREHEAVLGSTEDLSATDVQRLLRHPLPQWVERMAVSYLKAYGGEVDRKGRAWNLTWPDGQQLRNVVFALRDAELLPSAKHLTLEDSRVRDLALKVPRFAPGQPVAHIRILGISGDVRGIWSLWRVEVRAIHKREQRVMPMFLHDDGRVLTPTARHIWDHLVSSSPHVVKHIEGEEAKRGFERVLDVAEVQGKAAYDELVQSHRRRLAVEREKGVYAFAARRQALERIGLPAVRDHRLSQLEREEQDWLDQLERRAETVPDMLPLLLLRVVGGNTE